MGSELFHYYHHGIKFIKVGIIYDSIYSEYKITHSPDPFYSWNVEWFTRIKSNQALQRTVILKGYPNIPIGNYYCYFRYKGPSNIEKDNRILSDGRLWVGEIYSSILEKRVLH